MKTHAYQKIHFLERLPGLPTCGWHDSAASLLSIDKFFRSFSLLWFLLSLLCVFTWLSLVLHLLKLLDGNASIMTAKPSFVSKDRVEKSFRSIEKMYKGYSKVKEQGRERPDRPSPKASRTSPIVTLLVGPDRRVFVAHEDVLFRSPFFYAVLRDQFAGDEGDKVIGLPDEEPEILSCVLEFLYKGDYSPRLLRSKGQKSFRLEGTQDGDTSSGRAVIFLSAVDGIVLRDTVVYCAAERYGLEALKKLALRKQGLQRGIPVEVVLRSARYAYDNTPGAESRLRAHYLTMMIRARHIFKSSGTMQSDMEMGHRFYFDLFVAMCNHMDDLEAIR
ncbi:uncharacterized protein ACLA_040800 [Aspergillus clavatus NRRL 1]|uniref:BTB domain-containing protein n=1 Tax=Aspergillus clavatus (strain ATCC 1007 / CBS 513.65 / DSM 816 / NCTC 3887 / NRRL 1 / QM 1276 / 107) TaxID=344612 RepID=A1CL40_ASPCL|nr:uncharacterized protein ACLA_040800 [Aspergillus clavatus NRRL 1]EAW09864.1 conserved hypothetical protein [Aspergillus clavatus NRRL 1]